MRYTIVEHVGSPFGRSQQGFTGGLPTVQQAKSCPSRNNCMASGLPSPIKVKELSDMLINYVPILAAALTKGFKNGFDMGFRGVPNNDEK